MHGARLPSIKVNDEAHENDPATTKRIGDFASRPMPD
jgi:hypothetical protein